MSGLQWVLESIGAVEHADKEVSRSQRLAHLASEIAGGACNQHRAFTRHAIVALIGRESAGGACLQCERK